MEGEKDVHVLGGTRRQAVGVAIGAEKVL